MSLTFYAVISLVALVAIVISKSRSLQSHFSAMHALAYLSVTLYALVKTRRPEYYVSEYFFIDNLGIFAALITSILFLLSSTFSRGYVEHSIHMGEMDAKNEKLYYVLLNLLLVAMTYAFFSNSLALFWIFAELTTAFSAMLVVTLNAKKNIGAAIKYVFIASTCMLFSFIGLIFLFASSEHEVGAGTLNWNVLMTIASSLSPDVLFAAFAFTFIGFAAKSGIVPFHSWLPTAHSKAPAPISVILSGAVTSVGLYGILRMYSVAAQTAAISKISLLLAGFGIFSIAVATTSMLSQQNLKKLIGFSTIEHMGIILVGISVGTTTAMFWTLFHVLAHALTKALLFFSAGIIHHQYESVRIERIKDVFKMQPTAAMGLILGASAIVGMPPFAIFISKLFILLEVGRSSLGLLIIMLVFLAIGATGYARFLSRIFAADECSEKMEKMPEKYIAPKGMIYPIIILALIITVIGIFMPQYLNSLILSIVEDLRIAR